MHLLSRSRLFPITRTAIESFNNVLGDISNKLAVRAVRNAPQDR
jgi:hypothetical protein